MRITSQQNPRVKFLVSLHKRRERDLNQQFLVEGIREHQRLLASSYQIESVWYCPEITERSEASRTIIEVLQERTETGATQVSSSVFSRIAYRGSSEGIISVVKQPTLALTDLQIRSNPCFLIACGLEKPGNIGSILRSADAVASDGVIVCDPRTDFFNPNVIRASIGTVFSVPLAVSNPNQLIEWAEFQGVTLIATSPIAPTSYTEMDLTRPCGIIIGEEHGGLPDSFLDRVVHTVSLPVLGQGDSLNAAITAAIMLFETNRQRSGD